MKIKILSWNIWINGNMKRIYEFLKESDADIIGLQEVKDTDPKRDIIGFFKGLGYQYIFASIRKKWGGQTHSDGPALFSRYPLHRTKIHLLSETDRRAAVQAEIKVNGFVLHVFSTHFLHTHQQYSEIQDMQVDNLIKLLSSDRTIVMGDFNATPESSVIKKMKNMFVDSDPNSTPTWSVYPKGCEACNPQTVDIKLDYIFTTSDLKTHSFEVGNSKASDHLPISVQVEL